MTPDELITATGDAIRLPVVNAVGDHIGDVDIPVRVAAGLNVKPQVILGQVAGRYPLLFRDAPRAIHVPHTPSDAIDITRANDARNNDKRYLRTCLVCDAVNHGTCLAGSDESVIWDRGWYQNGKPHDYCTSGA